MTGLVGWITLFLEQFASPASHLVTVSDTVDAPCSDLPRSYEPIRLSIKGSWIQEFGCRLSVVGQFSLSGITGNDCGSWIMDPITQQAESGKREAESGKREAGKEPDPDELRS